MNIVNLNKLLLSLETDAKVHLIMQNYSGLEGQNFMSCLVPVACQKINSITLYNCWTGFVPEMPYLNSACFVDCQIKDFTNLRMCKKLKTLTICRCGLSQIPLILKELDNLDLLRISHNKDLTSLPSWISELPLKYLSVHENSITGIPDVLPSML